MFIYVSLNLHSGFTEDDSGSVPEPMEQAALKTGTTVSSVFNAVLLCPIL